MTRYYLSATTGAMISIEKDAMLFHKLMTKSAGKLKDLDDDDEITFIPRLPKEVPRIPKVKIGRDKIYSTLRLTLGVRPVSSELVLLPVWSLKVKHKKKQEKTHNHNGRSHGTQNSWTLSDHNEGLPKNAK